MNLMKQLLLLVFVNVLFSMPLWAQGDLPKNLENWSNQDVRDYCWNTNKYYKSQEESCPEDWKNQSAIFLRYEKKYALRYERSQLHVSFIAHYRIKILDQAALENFSEVYYVQGAHGGYSMYEGTRNKEYMNIRIIKPDGKTIDVDQKEIIEEDDGQRKVAIPNLEVGDVLDYALYTHDLTSSFFYGVIDQFTLNRGYPVKVFKYSLVTDENWDVQFTSGEHPIKLKGVRENNTKRYKFEIFEKNVEKIKTSHWNYYYRTGPYIRLYVAWSPDHLTRKNADGIILHTFSLDPEDIVSKYRDYYQSDRSAANEYAAFKGYLNRKYGKEEISNKKTLEELYYYMRHHFTNKHYVYDRYNGSGPNSFRKLTDLEFTGHIIFALKRMKVPYDIIVVVTRQTGRIEDVINKHQTDYLIRAKVDGEDIFFYQPTPYTRFNRFPYEIENATGYIVEAENKRGSKLKAKTDMLPTSKYQDNVSNYKTKVTFDKEDMLLLKASTKATVTGHQIENYQYEVVDWMQMIWDENELYKSKLWGHPSRDKSDKMKNYTQAQADERKSAFESIAREHFDIGDDTKLIDYKTSTTANTPDDSDLQFSFDCELSNLVKKVGPNYIVKAGYLVGGQLTLDEADKKAREVDIYMNFPRGYEYTIELEIPEGYEVKGLQNFENKVDNETGSLVSSASLEGNVLTLNFTKYYKNNYEPAKNWPLMVEFLEPGAEFLTKEILLKKKK